ncbi:DUF4251 domain-containing protein [Cognatitamlana onchidii]|uniref:DUF4251 domain-containing protein n=1 Tax=Cognatitamlana onchidii TaxID=2562860 RepID=UPI001455EA78|nr:DUF4251 domain-containing protein [Algibacter onchidii]
MRLSNNIESASYLKVLMLVFCIGLFFNSGLAQGQSKKELKEKEKLQKQEATKALLATKTFTFVGRTAIAAGGRTVDLTSNENFIKFSPEMVESEMPFFGQATGAGHYGSNDAGLYFKGKPENYSVNEKKTTRITMEVKDDSDSYRLNLSVSSEGGCTVTITSNRKSVMTYYGRISSK